MKMIEHFTTFCFAKGTVLELHASFDVHTGYHKLQRRLDE